MAGSRIVSRGTAYFAIISTLNLLLIMAAIANDGSERNSSSTPSPSTPTSTKTSKLLPSISSLIRAPGLDAVIKVAGGMSTPSSPMSIAGAAGKSDNSTASSMIDFINASSTSPFTTQNWTEVRAQYKSNALLPCHARNSGDGPTVSWIRRKDYHLLTVGLQTYSSDDRFQAIHSHSPDDWTLKIRYVQPRDAGTYQCTRDGASVFVNLTVVEVRAEIVGGPEKIYKAGSTVELKCDLVGGMEEPDYVFWFQNQQMINYDQSRQGRINVTNYKSYSVLILQNVQKSDTGNYTCVPSNAEPSSIFVHIINGENPAAMQHGSHSTSCVPCPPLWLLSFLLSLTLQALYFRFLSNHVDRYHERALYTVSSTPSSPRKNSNSNVLGDRASTPPFHHNHPDFHPSSSDKVEDCTQNTRACHRTFRSDQNHPQWEKLGPHNNGGKRLISSSAVVEQRGESRPRPSSSSLDFHPVLCRREGGKRQNAPLLPVDSPHSRRITVR